MQNLRKFLTNALFLASNYGLPAYQAGKKHILYPFNGQLA